MVSYPVFYFALVSLCVWIYPSRGQPTLIDFDFCENGSSLRQISATLSTLTEQTKALSVSVQLMQGLTTQKFSEVTSKTERLISEVRQAKSDISETMEKMWPTISTNIQFEINRLNTDIVRQISDSQDRVLQVLFNQSIGLSQLVSFMTNATSQTEFDPAMFVAEMSSVLNATIANPLRTMMQTKLSVADAAVDAVKGLRQNIDRNSIAIAAALQQEMAKVREHVESLLKQTTSGLIQRLTNRTLNTSLRQDQISTGNNSAVDDIVSLIQIFEKEQSMYTQQMFLEVSTELDEILSEVSSNRQGFTDLFSHANISGGFESIRQTVISQEMCPNKVLKDIIDNSMRLQTGTLRLVNGSDPTNGRVEVLYRGKWGTICDDSFDTNDAKVICRQLGLCGGMAKSSVTFGAASDSLPIHLDDVECAGGEHNILSCRHSGLGSHNCQHSEDVGVACIIC